MSEMSCRIAQVSRFALGIAQPLKCWHPCYGDYMEVDNEDGKVRWKEGKGDDGKLHRGWNVPNADKDKGKKPKDKGFDANAKSDPKSKDSANMIRRDLVNDLQNTEACSLALALAASGLDPVDMRYMIQQVEVKKAKSFEETAPVYDAIGGMFSCGFDRVLLDRGGQAPSVVGVTGSRARTVFSCAGAVMASCLKDEHMGKRMCTWSQLLCLEFGFAPMTTEAVLQIAHGCVETPDGKLISSKSFGQLATLLRVGNGGVKLLQCLSTHQWGFESAKVLADLLGLFPAVVHGTLLGAVGNVSGWVNLHECLFQETLSLPGRSKAADIMRKGGAAFGQVANKATDGTVAAAKIAKSTANTATKAVRRSHSVGSESSGDTEEVKDFKQSRTEIIHNIIDAEDTGKQGRARRFLSACSAFGSIPQEEMEGRSGNVKLQRAWLDLILDTLIPTLLLNGPWREDKAGAAKSGKQDGSKQSTAEKRFRRLETEIGADFADLLRHICALMLHVIAGQNEAGAEVLMGTALKGDSKARQDRRVKSSTALCSALGFNASSGPRFRSLMRLAASGCDVENLKEVLESVNTLAEPMLDYMMRKGKSLANDIGFSAAGGGASGGLGFGPVGTQTFGGVPAPTPCGGTAPSAQEAKHRISSSEAMVRLQELDRCHVEYKTKEEAERQPFGKLARRKQNDPILSVTEFQLAAMWERNAEELRDAVKKANECYGEVGPDLKTAIDHAREQSIYATSKTVPARMKLLLSCLFGMAMRNNRIVLRVLFEVTYLNAKDPNDASGLFGDRPDKRPSLADSDFAQKTSNPSFKEKIATDANARAMVFVQSLDQMRIYVESGQKYRSHVEAGGAKARGAYSLAYMAMQLQHMRTKEDSSILQARMVPGAKLQNRTMSAMHCFFIGFCTNDRGPLKDITDPAERALFVKEFDMFLPIVAAASVGRLDVILLEMRKLARTYANSKNPKAVEDMEVLFDILMLISVDKEQFQNTLEKAPSKDRGGGRPEEKDAVFLKFFIDRLYKQKDGVSEQVQEIGHMLMSFLVGFWVNVSPMKINDLLNKIIPKLREQAINLFKEEGNKRRDAASDIMKITEGIAQASSEGKSLAQMKLFHAPRDGEAQIVILVNAVLDLLMPFAPKEVQSAISGILKALDNVGKIAANPTLDGFAQYSPGLVGDITTALGVPKHSIEGIFALAQGKWEGAVDLCRPFCNIDPVALEQMSRLLPMVAKNTAAALTEDDEEIAADASRLKQISDNVNKKEGGVSDLFALIDLDHSGTISMEEFKMCTVRLGFQLNEHRIMEIFSKCKKGSSKDTDYQELKEEEFKLALDYVKGKIVENSMSLLGRSKGRLMRKLAGMVIVLLMLMCFIFLGINAFITGGTFNSIINSVMTICAGLGMSGGKTEGGGDKEDTDKIKNMVEQVKATALTDN